MSFSFLKIGSGGILDEASGGFPSKQGIKFKFNPGQILPRSNTMSYFSPVLSSGVSTIEMGLIQSCTGIGSNTDIIYSLYIG